MTEILRIMSAEQYFERYARNGIEKGMNRDTVKRQMLEDFRKEIFGMITMRGKKEFKGQVPAEGTPEAVRIAQNVIKDEVRKWKKLCGMFAKFRETSGLIYMNDLEEVIQEYDLSTHEKHGA